MSFFADRLSLIKPSPTLALNAKAIEMKSNGVDVVNLSSGEPDFDTPDWIKQSAVQAMNQGFTKYTPVDGMANLKRAIQTKLQRDNNVEYDLKEIVVGCGAKQVIFNAFMTTIEQNDEVVIPSPYWVSYPDMVQVFGGVPVTVQCPDTQNFKITPDQLDASINENTKWFILNSPSNPTGTVYTTEELEGLAAVLRQHPHVWVLADDIYEYLVYDGQKFNSFATVAPDLKDRTLIINGVSKAYAMTGWRIGYGAGPKDIIAAIALLQSQSTSNAASISQAASIAALNGPHAFLNEWRAEYQRRRDFFLSKINQIDGLQAIAPHGAFYIYVKCEGIIGKSTSDGRELLSDSDVSMYFLEEARVAVVPGHAFGLSPYFRISYAIDQEILEKACERIAQAVEVLK
jgi:aspartate aminotransferase